MTEQTETLLQKAMAHPSRKRTRTFNEQETELSLAWARGEVTRPQVAKALGKSESHATYFLASVLAQYVRNNGAK